MNTTLLQRAPRIIDGRWYWPVILNGAVVALAPEATHPDFSPSAARGFYREGDTR